MKRSEGLKTARLLKEYLRSRGFPIRRVVLYGSVAQGTAGDESDIDIAVVADPFGSSQTEEGGDILLASKDIDLRIETVCLHPEDFSAPFFTLAREIERTGIEV
jgi:uncharacterized protein